jgi:DNA-binding CsgD family transcriptional regulator
LPHSLPPLRKILDEIPYPTFGISKDVRVLWANSAACRYFGVTQEQLAKLDAKRNRRPDFREFRDKHLSAWLAGAQPYPVRYSWPGATGRGHFLLIPFPLPAFKPAAFALMLIPSALLDAALDGRVARSAKQARKWIDALSAEAEALREADAGNGLAARRLLDPQLESLTGREWEVARRIADGDRVALITEDLRISPNTVRNHLKAIFRKLEVHSQAQLVRRIRALVRER